jgi:hypothetical protein
MNKANIGDLIVITYGKLKDNFKGVYTVESLDECEVLGVVQARYYIREKLMYFYENEFELAFTL